MNNIFENSKMCLLFARCLFGWLDLLDNQFTRKKYDFILYFVLNTFRIYLPNSFTFNVQLLNAGKYTITLLVDIEWHYCRLYIRLLYNLSVGLCRLYLIDISLKHVLFSKINLSYMIMISNCLHLVEKTVHLNYI